MGRYYSGDIEGKFWFGVQSSDDADFFGGQQLEPSFIDYSFSADDIPTIEEGIAKCVKALGENRSKLDSFFSEGGAGYAGYNDESLAKFLGLTYTKKDDSSFGGNKKVGQLLQWYARLELGEKILNCVKKSGYCGFQAEI